jgi:hypothetical protein
MAAAEMLAAAAKAAGGRVLVSDYDDMSRGVDRAMRAAVIRRHSVLCERHAAFAHATLQ